MSLNELLNKRRIKRHKTDAVEIQDLLAIAERDIKDLMEPD
jgi:hypothetical protein